jgi:hypothetical protein
MMIRLKNSSMFSLPSSLDADLPPVGIHKLDRVDLDRTKQAAKLARFKSWPDARHGT